MPKPPSKGLALLKLFLYLPLALLFTSGLLTESYPGASVAWAFALVVAMFWRGVLNAVMGLGGQRLQPRLGWALVAGLTLVATLAAPPLSVILNKDKEKTAWKAAGEARTVAPWQEYQASVPERFPRPEFGPAWARARIHDAIVQGDVAQVRSVLAEIETSHKGDEAYRPAQGDASAALDSMYAASTRELMGRKGSDPKLQAAFRHLLDELSHQSSGEVWLVFHNQADLKAPAGTEATLSRMRARPEIKKVFPGGVPVLEPGEAFSQACDERRRSYFAQVSKDSFARIFTKQGLFTLRPLNAGESTTGKLLFRVDSRIRRSSTFYTHSREKRLHGLLIGILVDWTFQVVDRDGKLLYSSKTTSEPADKLHFRVQPQDPDWAPYSVMMDSAYDNYARQVIARFGIQPPPAPDSYIFHK